MVIQVNVIGIVCEYNPFHNGHIYHINKIKELYPDSLIVLVMSGSVTERGDLSIINKWDKTRIALNHNIDLVVELPFPFSSQSADLFCYGSMKILNYLKVDTLVFGSENNDVEKLISLAKTQLDNKQYEDSIKGYLKEGYNYPSALAKALNDITSINIKEPNDILGIGYIREIIKNNYNIKPITIKRTNDYNNNKLDSIISSATSIREALKNNIDISKYVPSDTLKYLNKPIYLDDYFNYLKYKIITEIDSLEKYQSVDENIIPRIKKYIYDSNNIDEFIKNIKTKNYTYNRIKRMLVHILMNFTKEEANNIDINYIRVLGFNTNGKNHLNILKKELNIPLITTYEDKYLYIENRISNILNINTNNKKEYEEKIIIKED
jgi:predicted nucleotidyltransferase